MGPKCHICLYERETKGVSTDTQREGGVRMEAEMEVMPEHSSTRTAPEAGRGFSMRTFRRHVL